MAWKNPIKTIRVCFFRTGHMVDHYMMADDPEALTKLIAFLGESDAVIVGVEELSDEEIRRLRSAEGRHSRSLFALSDCYGHCEFGSRQCCARNCLLNNRE